MKRLKKIKTNHLILQCHKDLIQSNKFLSLTFKIPKFHKVHLTLHKVSVNSIKSQNQYFKLALEDFFAMLPVIMLMIPFFKSFLVLMQHQLSNYSLRNHRLNQEWEFDFQIIVPRYLFFFLAFKWYLVCHPIHVRDPNLVLLKF